MVNNVSGQLVLDVVHQLNSEREREREREREWGTCNCFVETALCMKHIPGGLA